MPANLSDTTSHRYLLSEIVHYQCSMRDLRTFSYCRYNRNCSTQSMQSQLFALFRTIRQFNEKSCMIMYVVFDARININLRNVHLFAQSIRRKILKCSN